MSAVPASDALVADIDHLLIHAADADALLTLFADTFALPLAFPMNESANRGASAGVLAGNVLVEFIRWGVRLPWELPPGSARVAGLAFLPVGPVATTLALLDARGIPHTAPYAPLPTYTNVALPELLPDHLLFMTHVAAEIQAQRRVRMQPLLDRAGGPLGIRGVAEVVVAVAERATAERWQRLLAPAPVPVPGQVPLGDGPALRFEPGVADGIVRTIFQVKDLDRAAAFLAQQGLLGDCSDERVSITPERVQALRFDFTAPA